MSSVALDGHFLALLWPILVKKCLANGDFDFFLLGLMIEDITKYEMAKSVNKWIHLVIAQKLGSLRHRLGPI